MDAVLRECHAQLGIPTDYNIVTRLPLVSTPNDLVDVGRDFLGRPQRLTSATAVAWRKLRQASLEASIELLIVSGFRSPEYQSEIIRRHLKAGRTIDDILTQVAAPGFSEHHSGRAIDFTTPGFKPLDEEFENSQAFDWLMLNASNYGFRMSFPRDNPYGVVYEPWHWCFSA